MKLRILTVCLLAALILPSFITPFFSFADGEGEDRETEETAESEPDIYGFAKHIALYCIDTDTVLFEKNAAEKCAPSSTAKLMTALIAYERFSDLETGIELTADTMTADADLLYGFRAGETVTVYDLLCAMLIRNSNEAANALAKAVSGSADGFAALMNEHAVSLGMSDTLYSDPTGISVYSSTTVGDIIKLARAFAENDALLKISGSSYVKLPSTGVTVYSRNFYLSSYYNGGRSYINREVAGGITGRTDSTGDTLVSVSKHGSYSYICAITDAERADDAIYSYLIADKLVAWGSVSFSYKTLLRDFDVICNIPVSMGKDTDLAAVFPAESVIRYLPNDADLDKSVTYTYVLDSASLTAPVSFADKVGTLTLCFDGEVIKTVDLIVRSDIQRSSTDQMLAELSDFISAPVFIRTAVIIIALCVIYVLTVSIIRGQRQKKIRAAEGKNKENHDSD